MDLRERLGWWLEQVVLSPCPRCGSRRRWEILYGLLADPPSKSWQRRYVTGGCIVWVGMPTHVCKQCGCEYEAEREAYSIRGTLFGVRRPGRR